MSGELWEAHEYDAEAQRLYDAGDQEAALDVLMEGLVVHPEAPSLHLTLGYVRLAREEYAWARAAFEETLALTPDQEEALVGLGDTLLKLGDRSGAFLSFARARELGHDDDPDLMLAVARALYREGLYARAARHYRLAAERPEALAELGYCLYQAGDRHGALKQVTAALERDPELHEARVFQGNLLYERGERAESLRAFRKVPPGEIWDPLAVWRTVEMLRSYRDLPADDPALEPYLEQLERLGREPTPEERLLAELEAEAGGEASPADADRQQLDLFALGRSRPEGREPEVHAVRARDGRVYTGDWLSIVAEMRDRAGDPDRSVAEFMRETARAIGGLSGVRVPDDDPEAFLRASARAGVLRIER